MTLGMSSAGATNAFRTGATAMVRTALSKPLQLALEDGIVGTGSAVFDYGCGRGGDVERLRAAGYDVAGWDPIHAPRAEFRRADVVNIGYVINVIESPGERIEALRRAWELAERVLVVAARPDWEAGAVAGRAHGDGIVTSKGTFQRFFGQDELRGLVATVTGTEPIAAAPGIFYAFRNPGDAASVRARRFRHRQSAIPRLRRADVLWEAHRDAFEELANFWGTRGRLPEVAELGGAGVELLAAVGSIRAAVGVVRRVVDNEAFAEAAARARDDLLVFLALEAFRGRPKFSELPLEIALDVRALCGSYKAACTDADRLLLSLADDARLDAALRSVPFGKVLPDAVYIHAAYMDQLEPIVRVYEGAGKALLGVVEGATIIKMARRERRISYLSYPSFETDPHPRLASSLRADLRTFHVKWRDYRGSSNPPVLHRKETLVPDEHPSHAKFARLTAQEERAGLFADPTRIGTAEGWRAVLLEAGRSLHGHRLVGTTKLT